MVPSNSVTCPKCFKKIPPEPVVDASRSERRWARRDRDSPSDDKKSGFKYNKKIALVLDMVLGLFGILGIGQIYRDPQDRKGFVFLIVGIILIIPFIIANLVPGIIMTIVAVVPTVLYVIGYILAAVDILADSMFHVRFSDL